MKHIFPIITFLLFFSLNANSQEVGPKNGSLVIVGGGGADPALIKRFISLAGGPDANIVIIPTANGSDDTGPAVKARAFARFQAQGAKNLTLLHTFDRKEADSDEFVQHIHNATGVWFSGGRQWRLVDAYGGTKSEEAFNGVLERGGVIGGSSAGASIQGSYLVRGDTKTNTVMMGDHQEGFGYLKNVGIDQHLLKRNRQFDMVEVIEAHPELLGIGLDEKTGIVVTGDQFEVVGPSYVVIYDPKLIQKNKTFYFLSAGDRFNLRTREAFRSSTRRTEMSFPKAISGN